MTYQELYDELDLGRYQSTVLQKYIVIQIERNRVEVFQVLEERETSVKLRIASRSIYTGTPYFFLPKKAFMKYCDYEILHLHNWYYALLDKTYDTQAKKNLTILI